MYCLERQTNIVSHSFDLQKYKENRGLKITAAIPVRIPLYFPLSRYATSFCGLFSSPPHKELPGCTRKTKTG